MIMIIAIKSDHEETEEGESDEKRPDLNGDPRLAFEGVIKNADRITEIKEAVAMVMPQEEHIEGRVGETRRGLIPDDVAIRKGENPANPHQNRDEIDLFPEGISQEIDQKIEGEKDPKINDEPKVPRRIMGLPHRQRIDQEVKPPFLIGNVFRITGIITDQKDQEDGEGERQINPEELVLEEIPRAFEREEKARDEKEEPHHHDDEIRVEARDLAQLAKPDKENPAVVIGDDQGA